MAHFAYTRPGGVWAATTVIDHAEAASLDAKTFKAINGDEGGSWAPSSIISIAGSGLELLGAPFKLYDVAGPTLMVEWDPTNGGEAGLPALYLRQAVRVDFLDTSRLLLGATTTTAWSAGATKTDHSTTTADGNWTLETGTWTGQNGFILHGAATAGTWTFDNQIVCNGAFSAHGTATFTGDVQLGDAAGDAVSVNGTTTHTAPTNFNAAVSVTKEVTLSGDGRVTERVSLGANSNASYGVLDCDTIFVDNTTLTANRVYTLSATSAVNGSRIRFVTEETSWTVTISTPALGATVFVATAGNAFAAEYVYYSGAWHLASKSVL